MAGNWWQVDLGELKLIDTINLWNRTDCCTTRVQQIHVFVSDVPFTSTTIASSQNQAGVSETYIPGVIGRPSSLTIGRTGRYVRVQIGYANWLHLAEIEVIGDDISPVLTVTKTADITANADVGDTITYKYVVTNTGNVPISNVQLNDDHRGSGPAPTPTGETLTSDQGDIGDSTDLIANNGI